MRIRISLIIPVLLLLAVFACKEQFTDRNSNEEPIARVGQHFLYSSDVPINFSGSFSPKDSTLMVRSYIRKWITHQLIAQLAETNLPEATQDKIRKQVEETRISLYTYHYEQAMIHQKMDTLVADTTIQAFYESHRELFNLDHNIVRALFIQIPLEVPNLKNVRRWYRSDDPNDFNNLEGFCYQFATKFDDFNEQWIPAKLLLEKIPIKITNQERYLRTNRFIEARDSVYQYYVRINDYRLRGSIAPIEYVSDEIITTILNERKLTFIQEMENNIYSSALNRNAFEIY